MSRLKEDILYLIRAIQADYTVYEKQSDVLFTHLNQVVSRKKDALILITSETELNLLAVANKAASLLSQMVYFILYTCLLVFQEGKYQVDKDKIRQDQ